jgi:hypothetical protein
MHLITLGLVCLLIGELGVIRQISRAVAKPAAA